MVNGAKEVGFGIVEHILDRQPDECFEQPICCRLIDNSCEGKVILDVGRNCQTEHLGRRQYGQWTPVVRDHRQPRKRLVDQAAHDIQDRVGGAD